MPALPQQPPRERISPEREVRGIGPGVVNQGLGGTLSGDELALAGIELDPDTQQIFNLLQPPQPAAVPGAPGILPALLAGLGGGLAGQPALGAQIVAGQQQRIAELEQANRQADQAFRDQQLDLILAGLREKQRRAERQDDKQTEAEAAKIANELAERRADIAQFRAETERMRAQNQLSRDQQELLNASIQGLLEDSLQLVAQLDANLTDPEAVSFDQVVLQGPAGPIPFTSVSDLRSSFENILQDQLAQLPDPQVRKSFEQRFRNVFKMVDERLREFERRQGIVARRPQAEERAKRATIQESSPEGPPRTRTLGTFRRQRGGLPSRR